MSLCHAVDAVYLFDDAVRNRFYEVVQKKLRIYYFVYKGEYMRVRINIPSRFLLRMLLSQL